MENPVRITRGCGFWLDIPIEKIAKTPDGSVIEEIDLTTWKECTVNLVRKKVQYHVEHEFVADERNIAHVLRVKVNPNPFGRGMHGLEILAEDENGFFIRYYDDEVIEFVETTAEADVPKDVEFNISQYALAPLIVYVPEKGDKGDKPIITAEQIGYVTHFYVDGEEIATISPKPEGGWNLEDMSEGLKAEIGKIATIGNDVENLKKTDEDILNSIARLDSGKADKSELPTNVIRVANITRGLTAEQYAQAVEMIGKNIMPYFYDQNQSYVWQTNYFSGRGNIYISKMPIDEGKVSGATINVNSFSLKAEYDIKAIKEKADNAATKTDVSRKQDIITDLETIRQGAAKGATALQEHQDISGKQDVISDLDNIRSGASKGATALQEHQSLKTINGQSIVGSGNIEIQGGGGGNINYDVIGNVPNV